MLMVLKKQNYAYLTAYTQRLPMLAHLLVLKRFLMSPVMMLFTSSFANLLMKK